MWGSDFVSFAFCLIKIKVIIKNIFLSYENVGQPYYIQVHGIFVRSYDILRTRREKLLMIYIAI